MDIDVSSFLLTTDATIRMCLRLAGWWSKCGASAISVLMSLYCPCESTSGLRALQKEAQTGGKMVVACGSAS